MFEARSVWRALLRLYTFWLIPKVLKYSLHWLRSGVIFLWRLCSDLSAFCSFKFVLGLAELRICKKNSMATWYYSGEEATIGRHWEIWDGRKKGSKKNQERPQFTFIIRFGPIVDSFLNWPSIKRRWLVAVLDWNRITTLRGPQLRKAPTLRVYIETYPCSFFF